VVGSTNSAIVQNRANTASNTESKLSLAPTPEKNWMTLVVLYIENISVVILIRTDTTLDHSQKAEKVCRALKLQFITYKEKLMGRLTKKPRFKYTSISVSSLRSLGRGCFPEMPS